MKALSRLHCSIFTVCRVVVFALLSFTPHSVFAAPVALGTNFTTAAELKNRWSRFSEQEILEAAKAGNAEAQHVYGLREWEAAHEQNSLGSQYLFQAVADGTNLSSEQKQASEEKWRKASQKDLHASAQKGDKLALYFLGTQETELAKTRGKKAFEWMTRAAQQSLAPAEIDVAIRYLGRADWLIIPLDLQEGLKWLERSSEHGCGAASYDLAKVYLAGQWRQIDLRKADALLERAVAQGNSGAAVELARQYALGNSAPPSSGLSGVQLLRSASQVTNAYAFHYLAETYRLGLVVHKDYVQAIQLYLKSAQLLGIDIISGMLDRELQPIKLLNRDLLPFARILSSYARAVQRNQPVAMVELGRLYLEGSLVPMSNLDACCWFSQAARNGSPDGHQEQIRLESLLNPEERLRVNQWPAEFSRLKTN